MVIGPPYEPPSTLPPMRSWLEGCTTRTPAGRGATAATGLVSLASSACSERGAAARAGAASTHSIAAAPMTARTHTGPKGSQEGLALAAVGRDDVDDALALDQVQAVEALAELARLGVAQVDVVADEEGVGGAAAQRRLGPPRPPELVELQPGRQRPHPQAPGVPRARREVAAAERGPHAPRRRGDDRQREEGRRPRGEGRVVVEQRGRVQARARRDLGDDGF